MDDLTGHLLIAMPGMTDPRFEKSVVLLCEHSEKGAMGLIVNKRAPDIDASEMLEQLGITVTERGRKLPIHFGGPCEHARGFVLHSGDWKSQPGTLEVTEGIAMTATLDILEDIAQGEGPSRAILALGYAGWGPGQLETEFQGNGWLTCEGAPDTVFHSEPGAIWERALNSLGIDVVALSAAAGRA